jgi:MazG family protein
MERLLTELERHGVTPAAGIQLVSTSAASRRPFDPGMPLVLVPDAPAGALDVGEPVDAASLMPTGVASVTPSVDSGGAAGFDPPVLPGRDARGATLPELLRSLYPAGHPLLGLDGAADATVGTVTDAELAIGPHLLPPLPGEAALASPHALPWLVARLRAPGGCPWDREQTHESLRTYLLEEAYEVYDAIEAGATPDLGEELGDLLLQIVLHAHLAAEAGVFDLTDVYRGVVTKIIRRHPHVFGDTHARTADDVVRNWERIKADERAERPRASDAAMPAAFAGLSRSLPALTYAAEMQERAAGLGYDWPDVEGVIDKIEEEAVELLGATEPAARREEFGDLLFVVVNLGRRLGVDPESALRAASRKFASRFARVERLAEARGVELRALGPIALDALWQDAKADERAEMTDRAARDDAPDTQPSRDGGAPVPVAGHPNREADR